LEDVIVQRRKLYAKRRTAQTTSIAIELRKIDYIFRERWETVAKTA
jgi:hypothetical protein